MEDEADNDAEQGDEAEGAEMEAGNTRERVLPVYCTVCSLPIEYCEFQPTFEKCKERLVKDWVTLFPNITESDEITALMTKLGLEGEPDDAAKKARAAKRSAEPIADPEANMGKGATASGKKGKAKEVAPVVISINQRNKRKFVTSVIGLEHHGVKLADAAKAFGKKFSCGSSVVKGKGGQGDSIDIQGDFKETLADLIVEQFGVDQAVLYFSEGGKKTPMF